MLLVVYTYPTRTTGKPSNIRLSRTKLGFRSEFNACPCNKYPLKPHGYIEKLGFAGVYIIFLFLIQNIKHCGEVVLTCTHNVCFEQNIENIIFSVEIFNVIYCMVLFS